MALSACSFSMQPCLRSDFNIYRCSSPGVSSYTCMIIMLPVQIHLVKDTVFAGKPSLGTPSEWFPIMQRKEKCTGH